MLSINLIHKGFELAAAKFPQHTAVVFGDENISYSQLEFESNKIAQTILALASDESYIGLSTKKSIHTIAQILGILKSGKAYLPLDPEYPVQRQHYMIENSNLKFILEDGSYGRHWENLGLKLIASLNVEKSNAQILTENTAIAAVLFTSGSTGNPKGVQIGHLGLCQNLEFQTAYSCHGPKVKTIQYAHLAFDGAILEIFTSLWTGGELHLMEEIQRLDNFQLLSSDKNTNIEKKPLYLMNRGFFNFY